MDQTHQELLKTEQAVLFVTSAVTLSKRALMRLEAAALAARPGARLIRLEETGASLIETLDAMRADGWRNIRVQPLGVPFPEGLLNWLPGVLADWRARGRNADTHVALGPDPATDADALGAFTATSLERPATSVEGVTPKLGKPGWNAPPDFEFHLLVCVGPRCAIHGAAFFVHLLKEELAEAGITDRCLTTRTGCIYPCNRGPVLALYPHGHWFCLPDRAATRRFVREVLVRGGQAEDLRFHTARVNRADTHPQQETVQ